MSETGLHQNGSIKERERCDDGCSHLDDLQVVLAALRRQPLDAAELSALCVGVM